MEEIKKALKKRIDQLEKDLLKKSIADPDSASFNFFSVTVPEIQKEVIQKCFEALEKIKNGTFGFCEGCGEKISLENLKAVPSFEFCYPSKCF